MKEKHFYKKKKTSIKNCIFFKTKETIKNGGNRDEFKKKDAKKAG